RCVQPSHALRAPMSRVRRLHPRSAPGAMRAPCAAYACTTDDRGETDMRTRKSANWPVLLLLPAATAASAANHVVNVGGTTGGGEYEYPVMSFSPQALTIAVGDSVTFVNRGGV